MKKSYIILMVFVLVIAALGLSSSGSIGLAQSSDDATPDSGTARIFLPVLSITRTYDIYGKVSDPNGQPVAGVSIIDQTGNQTFTSADGSYALTGLQSGKVSLAAQKDGWSFNPTATEIELLSSDLNVNIQAVAACEDVIHNGSFENNNVWEFPATTYTASYTNLAAHTGYRSARTGILNLVDNRYAYSSIRQLVTIPADTVSADLRMWLYPISGEALNSAQSIENLQPLAPRPTSADFETDWIAGDVQYVLILDPGDDPEDPVDDTLLETIMWMRSDAQQWQLYSFDISEYAGETIKIQIGTYNDGYGGVSAMYADDVSLELCDDDGGTTPITPTPTPTPSPTPEPGTCTEEFNNLSFENTNAWGIPATEYTAGYTTNQAKTGYRSMRTGIEYAAHNRYSYSDAYQSASIPSGSSSATLEMQIYPMSTEYTTLALAERPTASLLSTQSLSGDVQYVLILDGYGNWIDTLLWQRKNTQTWALHKFDLSEYVGDYVRVQFGTYNDGWGGVTAMYVDDASFLVCP